MWQGHYYGNNFAGAKQDFAIRSGLIQRTQLFEQNELDELYRCCQRMRELDDTLTYKGEQQIIKTQEHIEAISPGVQERVAAMEMKQQTPQMEQTMPPKHCLTVSFAVMLRRAFLEYTKYSCEIPPLPADKIHRSFSIPAASKQV